MRCLFISYCLDDCLLFVELLNCACNDCLLYLCLFNLVHGVYLCWLIVVSTLCLGLFVGLIASCVDLCVDGVLCFGQ